MHKDFDRWNGEKKRLEMDTKRILFKTGEIWWCSVGINVGGESCGKGKGFRRPVLILRKLSHTLFIGIPISTEKKKGSWFCDIFILQGAQYALLYQIKLFSANRLQRRLTILDDAFFLSIKQKLKTLLEL